MLSLEQQMGEENTLVSNKRKNHVNKQSILCDQGNRLI